MGRLFKKYGSMILKKDSILYHVSDNKEFDNKNSREKPFLFCTFHPSEWFGYKYVHFIKILKDVRLFFMVKNIKNDRIISSLSDIIIEHPKGNLAKMDLEVQTKIKVILEKEYFDGWFTSIENKATVEVALLSGKNMYECIGTEKIIKAWRNGNCEDDGTIICKIWRKRYKLSFLENIIKLRINEKYKKMFEKYKKNEQKSKYIHEYIFQIILDSANIKYH